MLFSPRGEGFIIFLPRGEGTHIFVQDPIGINVGMTFLSAQ